jgi:predicted ArsR family transcriptional regulator
LGCLLVKLKVYKKINICSCLEVPPLKEAILRLLKKNRGTYVSGEEICKSLQVTRTAVWKHIQALREDDYEI